MKVPVSYTRAEKGVQLAAADDVRGTVVAADLLSYESVLGYWADLLHHYAALQTFTPQRLEGAVPASRLTSWLGRLVGAKPFGVVG